MGVRMRRKHKKMLKPIIEELRAYGFVRVDGETARKLGRIFSELGVRESVFIGNDDRLKESLLVDLKKSISKLFTV